MTRVLQDRLALANVKIQNGWENMSLDLIEPQVEERLLQKQRKRPASSNDTISDTASTTSSHLHSSSGLDSSPLTAPMYSDDFPTRTGSAHSNKRLRPSEISRLAASSGALTSRRDRVAAARHHTSSWKKTHQLPESSPISHAKHARFPSTTNPSYLSFISEGSTVPDSPPSPAHSEDDDADLPVTSFSLNSSTRIITSSPPRTPPPDRRMRKAHNVSWSRTPKTGEEGVDLLMYLATSPSPAHHHDRRDKNSSVITARNVGKATTTPMIPPPAVEAPSTPPCKSTPLPSSHMTPGTSGMGGFLPFAPNTPATNFNFADFVNVTPSPAQVAWTARTPVAAGGRTPAAAREARRRLNFDSLLPPTSPAVARHHVDRGDGLGMELGGELVS